eukprot:3832125-Rhodomonas_salina.1
MRARVVPRVRRGVELAFNLCSGRSQLVELSKQIPEAPMLVVPQGGLATLAASAATRQTRSERRCRDRG